MDLWRSEPFSPTFLGSARGTALGARADGGGERLRVVGWGWCGAYGVGGGCVQGNSVVAAAAALPAMASPCDTPSGLPR